MARQKSHLHSEYVIHGVRTASELIVLDPCKTDEISALMRVHGPHLVGLGVVNGAVDTHGINELAFEVAHTVWALAGDPKSRPAWRKRLRGYSSWSYRHDTH